MYLGVGIRNEKSTKPYISRVLRLSESLVIQKWYCIRLSHINFIQEKTSLVWTLSSSERGIFYAHFSIAWYCEFHCADFTNFWFLKSFFKKTADFLLFQFLTSRGLFFSADLTNFQFLKSFFRNIPHFYLLPFLTSEGYFSSVSTNL